MGNRVKRIGPISITKLKRRSDMRTWFSISPAEMQFNGQQEWTLSGVSVFGPKNGIVIDWHKLVKK